MERGSNEVSRVYFRQQLEHLRIRDKLSVDRDDELTWDRRIEEWKRRIGDE